MSAILLVRQELYKLNFISFVAVSKRTPSFSTGNYIYPKYFKGPGNEVITSDFFLGIGSMAGPNLVPKNFLLLVPICKNIVVQITKNLFPAIGEGGGKF